MLRKLLVFLIVLGLLSFTFAFSRGVLEAQQCSTTVTMHRTYDCIKGCVSGGCGNGITCTALSRVEVLGCSNCQVSTVNLRCVIRNGPNGDGPSGNDHCEHQVEFPTFSCQTGSPPPGGGGGGGGGGCNASSAACKANESCRIEKGKCQACPNPGPNPPPSTHPYVNCCEDDREVCEITSRTCKAPTSCTPVCPAGSSLTGTGPLVTTASCTHKASGQCNGSGGDICNYSCKTTTKTQNCYATFTEPPEVIDITVSDNVTNTPLGCFANGLTGREINNTMNMSVILTDPNGADDLTAFGVWMMTPTGSPPSITNLAANNPSPQVQNKNSFGLMVGLRENQWRIFLPRYSGNAWTWVNVNSIGNGERARIKGPDGKDLAILSDIAVTDLNNNRRRMDVKIEMLHEDSGVTNWDSVTTGNYRVFSAGSDKSRFFQGTGTTMSQALQFTQTQTWTTSTWTIDLEPPIRESTNHTVQSANRVLLNWSFSDFSGVKRVVGNARATEDGNVKGPIDDITSGVLGYQIGSAPTGAQLYDGNSLWKLNAASRSELIDIGSNEGNAFEFVMHAFDNACNTDEYIYNMGIGNPWIITKGGVVFSAGGSSITVQSLQGSDPISTDSYWSGDFGFKKDEADLSTELLTGGTSNLTTLINSVRLGSTRATRYDDVNNRSGYWFSELSKRINTRSTLAPENYTNITLAATTLSGRTSDIVSSSDPSVRCNGDSSCVVSVAGNLTINEGFICDTRTTFLVDGNITIEPNVTAENTTSGCMFVSSNDITIGAGQYHSAGSSTPKYDLIDGYLIADGNINIPETDLSEDIRDGLIIRGGLVAFGTEGGRSINFGRSLKLIDNNAFPTLAIHADNRYLNFATMVFGGHKETFKREVGFKPL